DQGCEITDDLDGGITQALILREMTDNEDELRAEFARTPSRHAAVDTESLGFVRSREHNPSTHGDGLRAQRGVEQLLDRGVEGVQDGIENSGFHPDHSQNRNIKRTRSTGDCQASDSLTGVPAVMP